MAKRTKSVTASPTTPAASKERLAVVMAQQGLNLRKTASKAAPVLTVLHEGAMVTVLPVSKRSAVAGWQKVRDKEQTGWVMEDYIKILED